MKASRNSKETKVLDYGSQLPTDVQTIITEAPIPFMQPHRIHIFTDIKSLHKSIPTAITKESVLNLV